MEGRCSHQREDPGWQKRGSHVTEASPGHEDLLVLHMETIPAPPGRQTGADTQLLASEEEVSAGNRKMFILSLVAKQIKVALTVAEGSDQNRFYWSCVFTGYHQHLFIYGEE